MTSGSAHDMTLLAWLLSQLVVGILCGLALSADSPSSSALREAGNGASAAAASGLKSLVDAVNPVRNRLGSRYGWPAADGRVRSGYLPDASRSLMDLREPLGVRLRWWSSGVPR